MFCKAPCICIQLVFHHIHHVPIQDAACTSLSSTPPLVSLGWNSYFLEFILLHYCTKKYSDWMGLWPSNPAHAMGGRYSSGACKELCRVKPPESIVLPLGTAVRWYSVIISILCILFFPLYPLSSYKNTEFSVSTTMHPLQWDLVEFGVRLFLREPFKTSCLNSLFLSPSIREHP